MKVAISANGKNLESPIAVITGNCGPKAMQVFDATTIKVIIGQRGIIKDAVEKFKSGDLSPSTHGNVPGKSGVAQTASAADSGRPGIGGGGRRGMGCGGRGNGSPCVQIQGTGTGSIAATG